ncbi:uncharacterized protein LOC102803678 [Saccoglossus kowalevskii]|uniref:Uncharacterized protein LOC102803678 n=1 Tax=Saccoglossus kowalevskii TaxID=10224 RepID=A0ABM0MXN6_SACKO|nr:PREDICTED: uncharacterized protein LOC102803678 [Saccoglossus kowalevskii]
MFTDDDHQNQTMTEANAADYQQHQESTFRKRTSSHGLRLDVHCRCDDDEVTEEGRELFQNFLTSEIRREGLREPASLTPYPLTSPGTADALSPTSEYYKHPLWAQTGKDLRKMADAFAKTKKRKQVKNKAKNVSSTFSSEFTYDQFQDLLSTLFCDGITRERIVVLFFFCSDLAILTLRQNMMDYFHRVLMWSLRYISDRVCQWVRDQGGWEKVIYGSLPYVKIGLGAAGVVVMVYFGYKWLKEGSSRSIT